MCLYNIPTQKHSLETVATERGYFRSLLINHKPNLTVVEDSGPSGWVSDLYGELKIPIIVCIKNRTQKAAKRTQTGLLNKVFELRREQIRSKPPPSKSPKAKFNNKTLHPRSQTLICYLAFCELPIPFVIFEETFYPVPQVYDEFFRWLERFKVDTCVAKKAN